MVDSCCYTRIYSTFLVTSKIGTTAAQKKLFFNLRKIKGQIQEIDDGDLHPDTVTEIANRLDVPEYEVVNMNRRLAAPDHSLNAPLKIDGDGEWQDWLEDTTPNQETKLAESEELTVRREMLGTAMKDLSDREQYILTQRRLMEDPMTLEELSQIYGISRERVRQIEVRAFEKIQEAMNSQTLS